MLLTVREVAERWRVGDEIGSSAIYELRAAAPPTG